MHYIQQLHHIPPFPFLSGFFFLLQNIFFLYYTLLLLISSTFMMRNILSPLFESCKKERHRFRRSGPRLIKSCDRSKINRKSSNPSQVCSPLSLTYILAINIDSLFNGAQRWNSENDLIFYATILKRCYLSFQKNKKNNIKSKFSRSEECNHGSLPRNVYWL